jgi:hypothetical protein
VLLCTAVCCCVLLCAAVYCCCVLLCAAVCCCVLLCAAVCCSVLLCAAVCCSEDVVHTSNSPALHNPDGFPDLDTKKRNSLLYS